MQCPSCGIENAAGTKFCIECGVPLQTRCPRCGSAHLPRAKFCGECGTPLPLSSLAAPPAALVPRSQPPLSYTPRHLAEKILTSRSALEGERTLSQYVGRARELEALHELLAQVERGQGQVVGMVGESGLGKSRLLYEFRQSCTEHQVTYLEGRCLSYGSAIPYLPADHGRPAEQLWHHGCG